MRLRSRLLISFFILISLPLALLGVLYYRTALDVVTDQAQNNVYKVVQKNNEVLDTRMQQIDQASQALFVDKELFDLFNTLDTTREDQILNADRKIKAILTKYFSLNDDVYMPQLWTTYFTFGGMGVRQWPVGDPTETAIYQNTIEQGGKLVWTPTFDYIDMFHQPGLSNADIDYRYLFSASRLMNLSHLESSTIQNLDPHIERPVLSILFTAEQFRSLFERSIPEGATYFVLSPVDTVIAHSDPARITKRLNQTWVYPLMDMGTGTQRMKLDGQQVIVCFDRSAVTGWLSVVVIPEASLIEDLVPTILTSTLVLAALLVLIAGVLAYFILGRITGPIRKLLVAMRVVGEGDFEVQIEPAANDELGTLIRRFNTMNQRIRTLVNENYEIKLKEQEAEIHALNMQMNPHFLYNTLNVMNWMAIENGQKELSKMLVSLSNTLHYTTRKDWGAVHLSEEIEWMNHYGFIMLARFEDKFTIRYEIDPSLYEYKVPRLLFQPFVENAILHGFDQMEQGGCIVITGRIEQGLRVYEVADNGRGMVAETIERILSGQGPSVGIQNTMARIRLSYGEEATVTITSKVGKGTTITIRLPLNPQE